MENAWDAVNAAVRQARDLRTATERQAFWLADLLVGNLRNVDSHSLLSKLKKELRDFDMVTGKWKK